MPDFFLTKSIKGAIIAGDFRKKPAVPSLVIPSPSETKNDTAYTEIRSKIAPNRSMYESYCY